MTAKRTEFKTKGEARVAIAKDVLKWIKFENVIVSQGNYVKTTGLILKSNITENSDLRTLLQAKTKQESCTVCALGAAFVTAVDRFNKVGCSDLIDIKAFDDRALWHEDAERSIQSLNQREVHKYLKRFFTPLQMDMIECAFEKGTTWASDKHKLNEKNWQALKNSVAFGCNGDCWASSEKPEGRLTRIMKNIIKNNGTFKP